MWLKQSLGWILAAGLPTTLVLAPPGPGSASCHLQPVPEDPFYLLIAQVWYLLSEFLSYCANPKECQNVSLMPYEGGLTEEDC